MTDVVLNKTATHTYGHQIVKEFYQRLENKRVSRIEDLSLPKHIAVPAGVDVAEHTEYRRSVKLGFHNYNKARLEHEVSDVLLGIYRIPIMVYGQLGET